ncbi:MAG: hypothetical protein FWD04_04740 [Conexibacteraceae bacterium]|nr:hypothetical protein [Conexibacteraceae bacterium]
MQGNRRSRRRGRLLAGVLGVVIGAGIVLGIEQLGGGGAHTAQASPTGIVPPANPRTNCDRFRTDEVWGIENINACRAKNGVGKMRLPSNWGRLTTVERGFVAINLERVNRGLQPIAGLTANLDGLAKTGAEQLQDPPFPSRGYGSGGAIWALAATPLSANYLWMYDDGPNGFDPNISCTHRGAPGCWLHRDVILLRFGPLVAGGASVRSQDAYSLAYLIMQGRAQHLTFSWARELHHFRHRPRLERLG